jgi:hypothetical protein
MAKETYTCAPNSRDPVQAEDYGEARMYLGCDKDCPNVICPGPLSPQDRRNERKKRREYAKNLVR